MATLDDVRALQSEPSDLFANVVYSRSDQLPDYVICSLDGVGELDDPDPLIPAAQTHVFAAAFASDKAWLYEGLRETQPLAYAAFMAASDPVILVSTETTGLPFAGVVLWTFVESTGRIVHLNLQYSLSKSNVQTFQRLHEGGALISRTIGPRLSRAYFGRFTGCDIPTMVPPSPTRQRGLVSSTHAWEPLDRVLLGLFATDPEHRHSHKDLRELLSEPYSHLGKQFPSVRRELDKAASASSEYWINSLRTLVDTRIEGDDLGRSDIVLVQTPSNEADRLVDGSGSPLLFHMADGNWRDIRVIEHCEMAIDQYVAHTLSNSSERFDFRRFAVA